MSRVVLIFGIAIIALMAGALFYAARIPVEATTKNDIAAAAAENAAGDPDDPDDPDDRSETASQAAAPAQQPAPIEVVTHPDFSLPDISGAARTMADWPDKIRILNFWATWCAPCRREIPLLKAFQEEQSGNGFQVIGIAVDYVEDVTRYAEAAEFNYPVLIGQEEAMAVAESSGIQFMALPFTMFIASDGEFISAYMGELHDEQLQTIVDVMTRLDRAEITADNAREQLATL